MNAKKSFQHDHITHSVGNQHLRAPPLKILFSVGQVNLKYKMNGFQNAVHGMHQHYLRIYEKCKFWGPTPDPLNQNFWECNPAILILKSSHVILMHKLPCKNLRATGSHRANLHKTRSLTMSAAADHTFNLSLWLKAV